ncbi:MAG: serine hydrolase [Methylophilus sp.]|nr:serine hydrolase [Methylophilus sp.]
MKFFLKHLTLLYVVVGLVLVPFESEAAGKKPRKSATVSSVKHKATSKSSRAKSQRVIKYKGSRINAKIRKSSAINQAYAADGYDGISPLNLASAKALVINQNTNEIIYAKNTNAPTPIASVTKLMTAMVILDSGLNLDEEVEVTNADVDYLKGTSSRLPIGTRLSRNELLNLALIASENRAASALATTYPAGRSQFIRDMNQKAMNLGMVNTHFSDSTGLDSSNVSTAEDLAKMVNAAYHYDAIRNMSTTSSYDIQLSRRGPAHFNNTNILVRNSDWVIGLSKTGFINEAGRCLVMQAQLAGEPVIIVLLDSNGKYSRIGDANRVRKWIEHNTDPKPINDIDDVPITLGQTEMETYYN